MNETKLTDDSVLYVSAMESISNTKCRGWLDIAFFIEFHRKGALFPCVLFPIECLSCLEFYDLHPADRITIQNHCHPKGCLCANHVKNAHFILEFRLDFVPLIRNNSDMI